MEIQINHGMFFTAIVIMLAHMQVGCSSMDVNNNTSVSRAYIQAEEAYSKKSYSLAKKHYLTVIESHPTHINALFRLGNISMREKKWDEAIIFYKKVLKIQPMHEKSHHNIAMLHLSLARDHLHYYIAHNNSLQNKPMGELIGAITRYSDSTAHDKTSLERLTDIIEK